MKCISCCFVGQLDSVLKWTSEFGPALTLFFQICMVFRSPLCQLLHYEKYMHFLQIWERWRSSSIEKELDLIDLCTACLHASEEASRLWCVSLLSDLHHICHYGWLNDEQTESTVDTHMPCSLSQRWSTYFVDLDRSVATCMIWSSCTTLSRNHWCHSQRHKMISEWPV